MTDKAVQFWTLHRDNVKGNVASGSLRRMVVNAVEGDGTIQVREVGTNTVHDEPYVALDATTGFAVGQYVIVGEVLGRGPESGSTRVVLGRIGSGSPSVIEDGVVQTASTTPNTSSVVTWATAISTGFNLPPGTWDVSVAGDVLLSHNVNRGHWRLMIDGTAGTEHNLSMVTEERFATYFRRTGLAGNRIINVRLEFKSFDAGTTSARNPRMQIKAVRTA